MKQEQIIDVETEIAQLQDWLKRISNECSLAQEHLGKILEKVKQEQEED